MRGMFIPALVSAALASVKYRSFRRIYDSALFMGPWTQLNDGSLARTGDERWSRSTEEARSRLAKILRDEPFSRLFASCGRVSAEYRQVVEGEAAGDVMSRVAYARARDSLIAALQYLAEVCLCEGRDPRASSLYESLELRHELAALLEDSSVAEVETFDLDGLPVLETAADLLGFIEEDPLDRLLDCRRAHLPSSGSHISGNGVLIVRSMRAVGASSISEFVNAGCSDLDASSVQRSELAVAGVKTNLGSQGYAIPLDIRMLCEAAEAQTAGRMLSWAGYAGLCVLASHPDAEVGDASWFDADDTTDMARG
ncbi:hypothetical protein D3C77_394540 [compost metagenome]